MPDYYFENTKTGETHSVFYHMNDEKDYRGPNGKAAPGAWRRVWLKPQMAVDAVKIDPYSAKDFAKATNKPGTIGDLYDRSTELAQKRADNNGGYDPVQEKFFDDYAKKRKGKQHPERVKRESRKRLKDKGISIIED